MEEWGSHLNDEQDTVNVLDATIKTLVRKWSINATGANDFKWSWNLCPIHESEIYRKSELAENNVSDNWRNLTILVRSNTVTRS